MAQDVSIKKIFKALRKRKTFFKKTMQASLHLIHFPSENKDVKTFKERKIYALFRVGMF